MPRYRLPLLSLLLVTNFSIANAQSVVDPSSKLTLVRSEFGIADGAAWDGRSTLYVPDVKNELLLAYSVNQKKWRTRLPKAGRISATFYQQGRLYLSDNAGEQILVMPQSGEPQTLAKFAKGERPNDLVVDSQGGVYVTLTRQGTIAYISPAGTVSVAAQNIKTPNGIILSPDGRTLYVSEVVPRTVLAFDVAGQGSLTGRRDFAEMTGLEEKGADGMTVDRAGNVYCGGPDGVWIWNPAGKLLDKILTPSKAINCAFGGDGRSLFISTLNNGLYEQRMLAYGREPHPPAASALQPAGRPETTVPEDMRAHLDVVYDTVDSRNLLADIFVPSTPKPHPTIVVVHGGGWLKGDKTKFRALSIKLAKLGYTVASIEYRLGFEAKFPAGIQDCNTAVRFLRAGAAKYSIDPKRIAAVGGSAGGHLVGLMAAASENPKLRGTSYADRSSKLQAAVVMAGPLQMATGSVADRSRTPGSKSNSNFWLGKTIDEDPASYKLADAYAQLTEKTPPILFMTGSKDNPERNAPAREKLKSLGVWTDMKVYPEAKHGCWNQSEWIDQFVADIDMFLKTKM